MQLSFIAALDDARLSHVPVRDTQPRPHGTLNKVDSRRDARMALASRPTDAQVHYLKRLTRIKTDAQLSRYIVRKLNKSAWLDEEKPHPPSLTKADFAKVIDMEVRERRLAG
jgi:hypothetical protein